MIFINKELGLDQICKIFIPDGLDLSISGINDLPVKSEGPAVGRVCLVLLTDLIIPRGGKLLCQLLRNNIWIVLIELDGFWEWQGLDTAILPGKAERVFDLCNCSGLMGMLKKA